jgi:hypothetical protein
MCARTVEVSWFQILQMLAHRLLIAQIVILLQQDTVQ